MGTKAVDARRAWEAVSRVFMADETHDRFHAACETVGLPHPGSLRALLSITDQAPMRTLAEQLRCDASYVTTLVHALEELGYVVRRVSPTDRRVKLVELTAAGRAARTRALEVMLTPPTALDHLNAAEVRTLARLLQRVAASYPPLPGFEE